MRLLLLLGLRLVELMIVFELLFLSTTWVHLDIYDDVTTLRCRALPCTKQGDINAIVVNNDKGGCWLSS